MYRRLAVSLVLSATLLPAVLLLAAEPKPEKLAAPQDWTGETIKLPPGFAPDMQLKGSEHIRFAPGMMKPASETFFCYAFVFELQPKPELTAEVIEEEFLKYFRGLCRAVLGKELPGVDPAKFTLELQRVKSVAPPGAADKVAAAPTLYTGQLAWVEPFATQKPQTLNLEIRTWSRNDSNYIFVCVSPQAPDAEIWKQLHTIRDNYVKQQTP